MTIRADSMTTLQKAVFSRLSLALSQDVFASVPFNRSPPYVVIGDDEVGEEMEASGKLLEHTISVECFSSTEGTSEAKTIAGEVQEDLTDTPLDLSSDDYEALSMRHEGTSMSFDVDDKNIRTHRATVSLSILVQNIA